MEPETPVNSCDRAACLQLFLKDLSRLPVVSLITETIRAALLRFFGYDEQDVPSSSAIACTFLISTVVLVVFIFHVRRRKQLARELAEARAQLNFLQEQLPENSDGEKKEIRVFIDGAFDLLHFGHMNAFRLARSLGTHLVAGVNSDHSIITCKGSTPLMNDEQRLAMVAGCKFVDEVVENVPYVMTAEYLAYIIKEYKIDYVVHGSDPCLDVNGNDVYAAAKQAGKFRSIPRTEGVSTTDLVGRMLLLTKEHHCHQENGTSALVKSTNGGPDTQSERYFAGTMSKFLTTSRMLQLFSAGVKAPTKNMRIVYVDGAWDLFHPGHVAFLEAARELGDYLIVGIHGDSLVNQRRGVNLPIMNLNERVLGVLGCKYVSDVLIDAPYTITMEMISSLNISVVVRGAFTDGNDMSTLEDKKARYGNALDAGIFTVIPSPSSFNVGKIATRIKENQETFQKRFEKKMDIENRFFREQHSKRNGDAQ